MSVAVTCAFVSRASVMAMMPEPVPTSSMVSPPQARAEGAAKPIATKLPEETRDAVEAKLQHFLSELFDGSTVGIRDDFFELGGDSIQAARFIGRIQSEMGVRLPLSILIVASLTVITRFRRFDPVSVVERRLV